jgi:hypothetical protein
MYRADHLRLASPQRQVTSAWASEARLIDSIERALPWLSDG